MSTTTPNGRTAAAAHAKATEAGKKAAATRKRNAAKSAAATVKSDAKRTTSAARTASRQTRRTTAPVKADASRTVNDTLAAADAIRDAAQAEAKVRSTQVRHIAERSVDLPVGVGLVARDTLVSTVRGLATTLSDRSRMDRELSRYERRGASARNRFETEVRRTRTDLEHEVRTRRTRVNQLVSDAQQRISATL